MVIGCERCEVNLVTGFRSLTTFTPGLVVPRYYTIVQNVPNVFGNGAVHHTGDVIAIFRDKDFVNAIFIEAASQYPFRQGQSNLESLGQLG